MPHLPDINYHHLRSFWLVAREGSIARACARLKVSQPTVSEQLRLLAQAMGVELFIRDGRRLRLTDTGRMVLGYADDIFSLGGELHQALCSRTHIRAIPVSIGISDAVSKLIACRLITPTLRLPRPVQVTVLEGSHEALVQRLATHEIDLVISDAMLEPHLRIRAFNHLLGNCSLAVFGAPHFAHLARNFPGSLQSAPMLLQPASSPQRRAWDGWCADQGIQTRVVAQVQDSALLKTLGQAGFGLFVAPEVIAEDVVATHGVRLIGRIASMRVHHYAISLDRRLSNPALLAITRQGRQLLS